MSSAGPAYRNANFSGSSLAGAAVVAAGAAVVAAGAAVVAAGAAVVAAGAAVVAGAAGPSAASSEPQAPASNATERRAGANEKVRRGMKLPFVEFGIPRVTSTKGRNVFPGPAGSSRFGANTNGAPTKGRRGSAGYGHQGVMAGHVVTL